jgi:hypothetical protein
MCPHSTEVDLLLPFDAPHYFPRCVSFTYLGALALLALTSAYTEVHLLLPLTHHITERYFFFSFLFCVALLALTSAYTEVHLLLPLTRQSMQSDLKI